MDWVKVVGVVFLAVFLILTGLNVSFVLWTYDVAHFFALVAGVLMLVSLRSCCCQVKK